MSARIRISLACAVVALVAFAVPVHAQWVEHGVPVSLQSQTQEYVYTCPDGEGGVILAWRDNRNGNFDIFAQRIDAMGNALWTTDGVPVCTNSANQTSMDIVSDGTGGVIIAFTDYRNMANSDIYAQRLDPDGVPMWTADGVIVCAYNYMQNYPAIATDGAEGAIISWIDQRGSYDEIYAQRINSAGSAQWTANGINATTYSSPKMGHVMVEDQMGGVWILFSDERNGNWDIYGVRIAGSGGWIWTDAGFYICMAANSQYNTCAASDGYGGVVMAWQDYRSGTNHDIYGQRLSNTGWETWLSGGRPICLDAGSQHSPQIITDCDAGAVIAWEDFRSGDYQIYASHVNYVGTLLWGSEGMRVAYGPGDQRDFRMISDGAGGAMFCWEDYRYRANYDIYAQHIDASGTALWASDGIVVAAEISDQMDPAMTTDGQNGAIVAWTDVRNANYDIYTQRIERNGYWGYPAPDITGVRDVPGDQGRQSIIAWDASRLDIYPEERIGYYTIWRAIDETAAAAMLENGAVKFEEIIDPRMPGPNDTDDLLVQEGPAVNPVIRLGVLAGEPYYWQQVVTVYSSDYVDHYAMTVYTLFDSTETSNEYHYYQVIAHESDPTEFWISKVDSGYSVDNLAPAAPLGLAGEQIYTPEGMLLTWDPNDELDLAGYNIYRGLSSDFEPGPGNFVESTPDTMALDGSWTWEPGYWYKIAAVDIHGNESLFALLAPDMVTGDDPVPLPDATFLAQNYPNPFNPITNIGFGIKEQGYISLRIYDAAGRLVATLIDESRPAGTYAAVWNGKDKNGSSAASGVYFYMLKTKEFEQTKKMILLR